MCNGHEIGDGVGLGGRLDRSDLVRYSRRLRLQQGLGVVDDLGLDPDAGESRRLNDCPEFGFGDEVGLSLLEGLSRGIGTGSGLSVDVDLRLGLRGGQSVLENLGSVDDLRRDPNTRCGDNFSRSDNLGDGADVGLHAGLDLRFVLRDSCRYNFRLGFDNCSSRGDSVVDSDSVDVVVAVLAPLVSVVDDDGGITSLD